eukprot:TRINITY_DN630_c0_g2_i2.p1 TRINITY_DN630_c0_g2~~TRINITY_DN630_c0_g2_i2.p1  ORF type:complete len:853 (+),score=143.48 TRINITY_DN630_c0_g2_i2:111-2669(+)
MSLKEITDNDENVIFVSFFSNESSNSDIMSDVLGICASDGIQMVPIESMEQLSHIYLTDSVHDDLENSQILWLTEMHDGLNLAFSVLKALNWRTISMISDGEDSCNVSFDEEIEVMKLAVIDDPEDFDKSDTVYQVSNIRVVIGSESFLRRFLFNAGTDIFSHKHGLLIVTHSCEQLLIARDDCDYDCMRAISTMLKRSICIDERNSVKDQWLQDVWLPQADSYEVDHRVFELYDNMELISRSSVMAKDMVDDNPELNFEEQFFKLMKDLPFEGLAKTVPATNPYLSVNQMSDSRFSRILESNTKTIPSADSFLESLTVFDGDAPPLSYKYHDFGPLVYGTSVSMVICLVLLFCFGVYIQRKSIEFLFGIFNKKDAYVLLSLATVCASLHICALNEVLNRCVVDDIVLPSFRFAIIVHAFICQFEVNKVIFNQSWKKCKRIRFSTKLYITFGCLVFALLCGVGIHWLGGFSICEFRLYAHPSSRISMIKVCNTSFLTKGVFSRWISSGIATGRFVLILGLYVMTKKLVERCHEQKGLVERIRYLELRLAGLFIAITAHVFLLINGIGSGTCNDDEHTCSALGDGNIFIWGPIAMDTMFIIILCIHPILQEVLFSKLLAKSSHKRQLVVGVKTFFADKKKCRRRSTCGFDDQLIIQDMICPCPYSIEPSVLTESSAALSHPTPAMIIPNMNMSLSTIELPVSKCGSTIKSGGRMLESLPRDMICFKSPCASIVSAEHVINGLSSPNRFKPEPMIKHKSGSPEDMKEFEDGLKKAIYTERFAIYNAVGEALQSLGGLYRAREVQIADLTSRISNFMDDIAILVVKLRRQKVAKGIRTSSVKTGKRSTKNKQIVV